MGSGAKNLALLQNQCKHSQLGNLITDKMAHNGKNYSIKLCKYHFCTTIGKSITSTNSKIYLKIYSNQSFPIIYNT